MEDCDLDSREFKVAVMEKLNNTQENSERQLTELRNKIGEQKEYFTKEIETVKKEPNRNSGGEGLIYET